MPDQIDPEAEPADAFDLPDGLAADHVVIRPRENPDGPAYVAIPFVCRDRFDDGTRWFHEPAEFHPTAAFAQAVAQHADLPADQIKIGHDVPTYGFEEVEPI